MRLKIRDVVVAKFPESTPDGHEQVGARPAVVLGLPSSIGKPRFDVLMVAPMTTAKGQAWAAKNKLYPILPEGVGGLPSPSMVLLDQARFLDVRRISRKIGDLTPEEYAPILEGIKTLLEIEG
jgi:mRNA interferase MazF